MKNPGCTPGQTWLWYKKAIILSKLGFDFHAFAIDWILFQFLSGMKVFWIAFTFTELFKVSIPISTTLLPFNSPTNHVPSGLYLK